MADLATDRCYCIPITCYSGDLKWGLIELQGELHVQEEREGPTFPVGTVCQSDFKGDALQLTIGNHQLEGRKVTLKKPFAVLEATQEPEEIADINSKQCKSYKVIGVLHDKYLFKTRPRPLISKPEAGRRR